MTTPVFDAVRLAYPDAFLGLVVEDPSYELVAAHPALDRVYRVPRPKWEAQLSRCPFSLPRPLAELASLTAEIRRERWDLVIDLQGLARSAYFLYTSRGRRKVGRGRWAFLSGHWFDDGQTHAVDKYLRAAREQGLIASVPHSPRPRLALPPDTAVFLAAFCRLHDTTASQLAVVNPLSRWSTKNLTPEQTGRICCLLRRRGLRPVLVGTADAAGHAQAVLEAGIPVIDTCGRLTLPELYRLIAGVRLTVSVDSAAMHLASAAGAATLALFGPTRPELTGPRHARSVVLQRGVSCLGCLKRRCPYRRECMDFTAAELSAGLNDTLALSE